MKAPADGRRALSTLVADVDDAWNAAVRTVRPQGRPGRPRDLLNLWRQSRGREVLILQGSAPASAFYRDLVLVALMRLRPRRRRPRILLTDATWETSSATLERRFPGLAGLVPVAMRVFVRLIDSPRTTYGVLSRKELETFPGQWGIDPARVVFVEFEHTLWGDRITTPVSDGDYVFAGGNSLRDYPMLERAVSGTGIRTIVAAHWAPERAEEIESRAVSEDEFFRLLGGCRVAVVPLRDSIRSAGQQTYLNAMALGKPVIVTDAPGARDYIRHGENGWIAAQRPDALRAAIQHVMDPENALEVSRVAAEGRREVRERWTEFTYRAQLLRLCGLDTPPSSI